MVHKYLKTQKQKFNSIHEASRDWPTRKHGVDSGPDFGLDLDWTCDFIKQVNIE